MPAAPVIGIPTYPRDERGRVSLQADYVDAVRRAGGIPWLVPPGEPRWREVWPRVDGWILAGGGDVEPALYGGAAHAAIYGVDRARDELEIALVRQAIEDRRPTLGICRGCQVVNVALGGTLVEHLPDAREENASGGGPIPNEGRAAYAARVAHRGAGPRTWAFHAVQIERGSRLERVLGRESPRAASSHHQAVRRVAEGLAVSGRTADGTIEALELADHPFLLAVQWHPEHTAAEDPGQQRLFDALVEACHARR
jgi:putative glutamine amidotransferase